MRNNKGLSLAVSLLAITLLTVPAKGDPCGMVPPIYVEATAVPIERVGRQKTYVFYKNGLETLVIRPGFTGQVEEFGMLIPFPTPPAIRKVPDEIFPHLAAAIDPPEVVIDLRWQRSMGRRFRFADEGATAASEAPLRLAAKDEVRVIREEAVGMYEVVVLDAGSARALKRWMDDHEYRYPKGMDEACDDYVKAGWCFVAVRTQVGHKSKVDPQPGQMDVDTKLAPGTSFDGHVQAMGFRFRSRQLTVPMRLSTFNEGDLHNIVYLLTDRPSRINRIPLKYVVRQVEGGELVQNLTGPLPLRILGGTTKDIRPPQRESLKVQRNPEPHNRYARDLFASDLACAKEKRLAIDFEETEKELLQIGELLNLRGPEVDRLHRDVLQDEREIATANGLAALPELTLTVIDGDFARDVLASANLTFSAHRMPKQRNTANSYDARRFGPAPTQEGTVIRKSIAAVMSPTTLPGTGSVVAFYNEIVDARHAGLGWLVWLSVATLGTVVFIGLRRRRNRSSWWGRSSTLMLLSGSLIVGVLVNTGRADRFQDEFTSLVHLLDRFEEKVNRPAVISNLRKLGRAALDALAETAATEDQLTRRGWAVVCLSQLGGEEAGKRLHDLASDISQPQLVRIWSVSALFKEADSVSKLIEVASGPLPLSDPVLHRPFQMRLAELLAKEQATDLSTLLDLSSRYPFLNATVVPSIRAQGLEPIIEKMLTSPEMQIRQQAAAILGSLATTPDDHSKLARSVVAALKFAGESQHVPWHGGPLFLPSITWSKEYAHQAIEQLLSWWLWCERRELDNERNIILNNLWVFTQQTGVTHRGQMLDNWLLDWGRRVGNARLQRKLELTGMTSKQRLVAQVRAIEAASETTMMTVNGGWKQVGVLQREGKRVAIVYLEATNVFEEWVRADQVASPLESEEALKKASVDDKYSNLLHVIESKDDFRSYRQFSDYGFWNGRNYAGHQNLQSGYWVYVFPNWYVWKTKH